MNKILRFRLALGEAQAQLPAQALIHPEQSNIPPIMEPIPAQLPELQNEGLAMNIDQFIVEPEFLDLYAQENLFDHPVGENPSNNGIFLPGCNGADEPEIYENRGLVPEVEHNAEKEPLEIQGVSRMIQPLYHAPIQDL